MKALKDLGWILFCGSLTVLPASLAWPDGCYVTKSESIAISADQRAILIKNSDEISMTLSTGYTGEGNDFAWIIPTPVPPAIEDVFETGEDGEVAFEFLDQMTAPIKITGSSGGCFPAGTPVPTAYGLCSIDAIEPGMEVYSYDLRSGKWSLAKVAERRVVHYEGDVTTIRTTANTLLATGNHPFYVRAGEQLASRPPARDVPRKERGTSDLGRWVEARDLRQGDMLFTKIGDNSVILSVSVHHERLAVYNLAVEGYHNYAVHREGILVHNKGGSESTGEAESLVTVYGRITLANYDVSILGAADASALLRWLQDNEYQVTSDSIDIFDDYIERGWSFVAVKLNPGKKRRFYNEFLPPLTIRYHYKELVFPLLISSISTAEQAKITLYVIAESAVDSSNFRTAEVEYDNDGTFSEEYVETCIQNTLRGGGSVAVKPLDIWWRNSFNPHAYSVQVRRDEEKVFAILWRGAFCPSLYHERFRNSPYADNPGIVLELVDRLCISPLLKCDMYLTRLEARISPADMTEDISFVIVPETGLFEVRFERRESEVGIVLFFIIFVIIVVSMVVGTTVLLFRKETSASR